ncbi:MULTISPECIES: capsid protein [Pseudoalteromonas]|uniref:Capsid protein n=1 Tax=Pseudoalteromonas amylolytica TaxID=1859457 RepID=A0A1S1MZX9_9GAMM|nr:MULTISPECIES: capsid protein [Pseudoalteromonas]OHU85522.1 capsid protein [Pseudoalteromonas sp. JW3]OHU91756.1 capsid protein [Pseudoalteromonas amylolytica]
MSNGMPFTPDVEQTAVAIAYTNRRLIADTVIPYAPVGRREYKWTLYKAEEKFTVPDTKIGRKSSPNQVEFSVGEMSGSVTDYGLADVIPNDDVDNAPANYNPRTHAAENITDLILLGREVRVANLFNTPTNFGTHKKLGTAELKRIDDPELDILPFLLEVLDTPLMRPNAATMSQRVATALRTNKRLIKAYNGSLGDEGLVPWQFIKDQLELEHINIGQARLNTAKKGKEMMLQKAWKDSLSFTYHDPLANFQNKRMTFALTARYGDRKSGFREVSAGLNGGVEVMVGESVEEQVIAKDCGILLTDVLTPAA